MPTASSSDTCPGVLLPHDFPPQPGDLFWTPADWAWIGGLYDVLFPAWHWGLPGPRAPRRASSTRSARST